MHTPTYMPRKYLEYILTNYNLPDLDELKDLKYVIHKILVIRIKAENSK